MNVLEKIDFLRKQRGWTIYKLAENAGINQSTLSNMFTRKTLPNISTLTILCEAFGISLAEFFTDDNISAPPEELALISNFRKLTKRDKDVIVQLAKILSEKK